MVLFIKLIFIFLGLTFIIAAKTTYKKMEEKKQRCTLHVNGTVKDIIREVAREEITNSGFVQSKFFPVFEYTVDGVHYEKASRFGSANHGNLYIGKPVNVFVNPNDHDEYYVEENKTPNFVLNMFIFIGIMFIVIISISTFIDIFLS